ncbi:DNA-binding transcriptional regulator, XRE-family HTH domain [Lentibacillus halodurans]|uniref:DNA-binding transcriptional regulator, XRE-family HTH domain n=1 Tax=Lentibacillus halodurans TaxID=237679 RepID=A0A1I0YVC3_9BACI|nr:helix-turn-helix transcriptional regulator [Lentibacillus halodurans]SFB16766.1 DNA-binding transcriptional regulator, XRE-family HTH domain [Lentibacillus halodurans]
MNLEKIAYNIKFLREQNGWTQEKLAAKLNISRYVVIRWETNKVIPDLESLIKLSELFDVTIDHIVGNHSFREDLLKDFKRIYSSKTKPFDEEAVELIQYLMENPSFKKQVFRLRNLPIRKQQAVHDMLENFIEKVDKI